MKGKAQISSQVFIYILAAIIVGLILIIGYRAIASIVSTVKQVDISDVFTCGKGFNFSINVWIEFTI